MDNINKENKDNFTDILKTSVIMLLIIAGLNIGLNIFFNHKNKKSAKRNGANI